MRWRSARGATASLGAAALIGTQWAGSPTTTAPAPPRAAPSREALAQELKQAAGAEALAEGRVSWQAKPGAPDEFIPSGSARVGGTQQKCTVRGEADLAAGDGERLIKRDAQGKPVEYRGGGIKTMPLHITDPRISTTQTLPVAWFGTAEAFRPIGADGSMDGSLDPGVVHWTWRFTR